MEKRLLVMQSKRLLCISRVHNSDVTKTFTKINFKFSLSGELLLATSLTINQSAIPALESLGLELPALESGASSESEDEYEPIKRQL